MQITVRLCRSSSRCFRYVIIHTVIPCNLQKSRIGTTPRYYSICEISRDRSIRRVNNTNLKGRRNDAYVGSALCLRHQEENALHLVQFIESTDCVGGFASLSLSLFFSICQCTSTLAREPFIRCEPIGYFDYGSDETTAWKRSMMRFLIYSKREEGLT